MAAGGLLLLFLFLQAQVVFETLHRAFHHDCGHAEHSCVVTQLAQGQVDSAPEAPLLAGCAEVVSFVLPVEESFAGFPLSNLLPGRAPPGFSQA
jgi:hypothetical protein